MTLYGNAQVLQQIPKKGEVTKYQLGITKIWKGNRRNKRLKNSHLKIAARGNGCGCDTDGTGEERRKREGPQHLQTSNLENAAHLKKNQLKIASKSFSTSLCSRNKQS